MDPLKKTFLKAFEKIKNPATFTKGAYARNTQHHMVAPAAKSAVRFCSVGAVWSTRATQNVQQALLNKFGGYGKLIAFNDTNTHKEVVAHWQCVGECNGWLEPEPKPKTKRGKK